MPSQKQVSFRPDDVTRYAVDRLVSEDYCQNNPQTDYETTVRGLVSHLIKGHYQKSNPDTLDAYKVAAELKFHDWPSKIPFKYRSLSSEQTAAWIEKDWKSWKQHRWNKLPGEKIELPTTALQIGFDQLMDCINGGIIAPNDLNEIGPPDLCIAYHDLKTGDLVQSWRTTGRCVFLERVVTQKAIETWESRCLNVGPVRAFWRLDDPNATEVPPDIDDAQKIQEHVTSDNKLFEILNLRGVMYSRTTQLDKNQKLVGPAVVKAMNQPAEPKDLTGKKLDELDQHTEFVKDLLYRAKNDDRLSKQENYEVHQWEKAVNDVARPVEIQVNQWCWKYHRPEPDWSQFREEAYDSKDIDYVGGMYEALIPYKIIGKDDKINSAALAYNIAPDSNHHLSKFYEVLDGWEYHLMPQGRPATYYERETSFRVFDKKHSADHLLQETHNARNLTTYCAPVGGVPTKYCFMMILGYMNTRSDHVKAAYDMYDQFKEYLDKFRGDKTLTRRQAYKILWTLRATNSLPGLRPSTYSALIHFLRPKQDGYILSPHAAKSVNLIAGEDIVHLTKSGYPTDDNNDANYEAYCSVIDQMKKAAPYETSSIDIRERMECEGYPLDDWKDYIKELGF